MADKSMPLILTALSRAAADPVGLPLHGTRTAPGLFAATAAGKLAAQRCKEEGYLRVLRTETRGKAALEVCTITEKGLAYLLAQTSPRQVLEDLVRALQSRQAQADELLAVARQMQEGLEALRATAEKVLEQVSRPASVGPAASANGAETWPAAALACLARWEASGASEDCPLPELYRQTAASLTIGQFHDGLRRLYEQAQIYLHPWTGPLYEIPEPPYALLIGHEIAYYASLRR
ncbi:MAG TPA: hypothetical protein VNK04_04570 [Gemmataceae bacterium]|jgi:hypothetical protein|nr:hypothetical protein [Gemmataceae bacterium]